MPIDVLITKYCVTTTPPRAPKGEIAPKPNTPAEMGNHRATALIDGPAYFSAIDDDITALAASAVPGRFFYMSAWWFGLSAIPGPITVEPPPLATWTFAGGPWPAFVMPRSGRRLSERLKLLSDNGVNVRVLPWFTPHSLLQMVGDELGHISFPTALSAQDLRILTTPDRVALNTFAHSMGAAHIKMVVCGDQNDIWAYVSGLDPQQNRLNPPGPPGGWHDIGVRVEGLAADQIYAHFKNLWDEQLKQIPLPFKLNTKSIVTHEAAWSPLPARALKPKPAGFGKQYVQVLRTIPQMNFTLSARDRGQILDPATPANWDMLGTAAIFLGFVKPPISFAPDGMFEFKVALKQAISQAERYIFIADQSFSSFEVMKWIADRMRSKPDLKVILLHGADPTDPPSSLMAKAINDFLMPGLPLDGGGRIKNAVFYQWNSNVVHPKVTIIDDTWCAIGSANCMRRSLYTDIELSVGIIEEPVAKAQLPASAAEEAKLPKGKLAPSFVQDFRRRLWGHYCGIPLDPAARSSLQKSHATALLQIEKALAIWRPAWGTPTARLALRPGIVEKELRPAAPFPLASPFSVPEQNLLDADSRNPY